jgi:hypothetical protein
MIEILSYQNLFFTNIFIDNITLSSLVQHHTVTTLTQNSHNNHIPFHLLFTSYSPPTHLLFTSYSPPIHLLLTSYSPPIHPYSPPVHLLFTSYSPPIPLLLTSYSLWWGGVNEGMRSGNAEYGNNEQWRHSLRSISFFLFSSSCSLCLLHLSVLLFSALLLSLPSIRSSMSRTIYDFLYALWFDDFLRQTLESDRFFRMRVLRPWRGELNKTQVRVTESPIHCLLIVYPMRFLGSFH